MKEVTLLSIDLAKNVFELVGDDALGKEVLKRRLRRNKLLNFIANLPPCTIAIEACIASHYWARKFQAYGHTIKMMPAKFVKPYRLGQKNDYQDAIAIGEAARSSKIRLVQVNTIEQQDLMMIHRIRARLVKERTRLTNQIRGVLVEYGIFLPTGFASLKKGILEALASEDNELSFFAKGLIEDQFSHWQTLEADIQRYDNLLEAKTYEREDCQRIMKIEGIGTKTASAIVAQIGNGSEFKKGRDCSAYMGLVPKQHSSGDKKKLYGIPKREGNRELRSLLIHGARSVVSVVMKKVKNNKPLENYRQQWIAKLVEKRGFNKAVVALANKNARIIWAVLSSGNEYQPS